MIGIGPGPGRGDLEPPPAAAGGGSSGGAKEPVAQGSGSARARPPSNAMSFSQAIRVAAVSAAVIQVLMPSSTRA